MEEVYKFLKQCGTYYLATVDGDQPRVRPFGTALIFENKLYIQTGKAKNVSKQIEKNPKIEICSCFENTWVRIEATAIEDDRDVARQAMLDAYPQLKSFYAADDGNTQVFYLTHAVATFASFDGAPKVITF